ncbi:MAG: ABC transporter substrate-binding protein [Alphaproteobacteria bacterium]
MSRSIKYLAVLSLLLTAAAAEAQQKLTVLLDWHVNPDHGPLYVALERGYYKAAGLDVDLIAPSDPNDPPRLVAAKKGDVAISYQPQLHIQASKGLPLVRIGTLVATPLNTLVVLRDGPIKSVGDLKGKRIGYSVGGFEEALLTAMLGKHGLALKDVTLVNVNFSLSPALMAGQVEAVIGAFRNFELNQMDIAKRPGRAFYPEENGVPAYDELIYVAHRDTLGDKRLLAFLGAVEQGVQYLLNYPEEGWKLFVKGREKELDNELNRRAWRDTLPRFAASPAALDTQRYRRFAEFLLAMKVIENAPPVSAYAADLGAR